MNRVVAAIERQKTIISQRLANGLVTQDRLDSLNKTLDMDIREFCKYQEIKSLAFAMGKLTLEEAQTLYNLLGMTCLDFNSRPLEVKVVLTRMFAELIHSKAHRDDTFYILHVW